MAWGKWHYLCLGIVFLFSHLNAECGFDCEDTPECFDPPQTRRDNLPQENVVCSTDEYLTGYLQALIDVNYYEFTVRVLVRNQQVFLYNLPSDELIAQSMISFIADVPGVCAVFRVDCPCNDYCSNNLPCCQENLCAPTFCPSPCWQTRGIWFPQSTVLFAPLIADPRQVTNSAAIRFNDNVIGKYVGAVSFGDEFGFYRWLDVWPWHGDLQFGIEAGIFSVFHLNHPEKCLVNTDFFVAGMFSYAVDRWSWRFRLWHLSSHLGDEFLLCNPGFDRRNLSDEGTDLFVSYQIRRPIRLYAGLGYIFDRDKSFPEHPLYFEFGTEIRMYGERDNYNKLYIQPFLAMHFRTWEEHDWSIDQTYALGIEWSKLQGIGRRLRLFAEYHDGYSREGQFLKKRVDYYAIRMTYGF